MAKIYNRQDKRRFSKASKVCEICGTGNVKPDNHHIIHKADGGSDYGMNRIYLCPNHHRMVHAGHIRINGWKDLGYTMELDYDIITP